jgi:hypothetical protein
MPFTDHVTPVLLASTTDAVINSDPPVFKLAYGGETRTETALGMIVKVADAETPAFVWLVAVTVTVFGVGTVAGAV